MNFIDIDYFVTRPKGILISNSRGDNLGFLQKTIIALIFNMILKNKHGIYFHLHKKSTLRFSDELTQNEKSYRTFNEKRIRGHSSLDNS